MNRLSLIAIAALSGGAVLTPRAACAQAGPPYLTNDPGAPGNGNWEINVASMTTRSAGVTAWQMSVFPQYEAAGSPSAQRKGIAAEGSRLLLPLEASKEVGPLDLDFEAGYYFAHRGPEERILGFVAGHQFTPRLELDAELYNDHAMGAEPNFTTLDVGGRCRLGRGFILLFMAGRSIANSSGEIGFMSYLGVQILLSDYGLHLEKAGSE